MGLSRARAVFGGIVVCTFCVFLMTIQAPSEVGTPGEFVPEMAFVEFEADFDDNGDWADSGGEEEEDEHRVAKVTVERDILHPMNPRGRTVKRVSSHVPSNSALLRSNTRFKRPTTVHRHSHRHAQATDHVISPSLIQGESLSSDQADAEAEKGWTPPSTLSLIKSNSHARYARPRMSPMGDSLETLVQSSAYYQSTDHDRDDDEDEDENEDEDDDEDEDLMEDDEDDDDEGDDDEEEEEEAVEEDDDYSENHMRSAMELGQARARGERNADRKVVNDKLKQLEQDEETYDQYALKHPLDVEKKKEQQKKKKPLKFIHVGAVPSNSELIGANVEAVDPLNAPSPPSYALDGTMLSEAQKRFIKKTQQREKKRAKAEKAEKKAAKAAKEKKQKEDDRISMPTNMAFLDDSADRKAEAEEKKKRRQEAHRHGKFEDPNELIETLKQKELEKMKQKKQKQKKQKQKQHRQKQAQKKIKKALRHKTALEKRKAKKHVRPGHLEDLSGKDQLQMLEEQLTSLEALEQEKNKKAKREKKQLTEEAAKWLLDGEYVHAERLNDLVHLVRAHRGMQKADLKKLVDRANENGDPAEMVLGKVTAANAKSAALKAVVKAARKSVKKQAMAAKDAIDTVFKHAKKLPEEYREEGAKAVQKDMLKLLPLQIALQKKADDDDDGAKFCYLQWYQTLFRRSEKRKDDSTVCWAEW